MGQRLTHQELMKKIGSVPAVAENRRSLHYKMGMAVLKKRLELNLTQEQLVERIKANGASITQATISKVESAETEVKAGTYEKLIEVLGIEVELVDVQKKNEKDVPTNNELQEAMNNILQGIQVVNSYTHTHPVEEIERYINNVEEMLELLDQAKVRSKAVPKTPKSYKGDYQRELKNLELSLW